MIWVQNSSSHTAIGEYGYKNKEYMFGLRMQLCGKEVFLPASITIFTRQNSTGRGYSNFCLSTFTNTPYASSHECIHRISQVNDLLGEEMLLFGHPESIAHQFHWISLSSGKGRKSFANPFCPPQWLRKHDSIFRDCI